MRHGIGHDATEKVGNRFGVAGGAEEALNPCTRERGEKVLQVHAKDNALANVRAGKALDAAPFHKAVNRRVRWDVVKNFSKNLALQLFQARLGSFDQTNAAGGFRQHAVVIML